MRSSGIDHRTGFATALLALLVAGTTASCQSRSPQPEASPPPTPSLPADAETAAAAVTESLLGEHLARLAADEMEGRGPASRGEAAARAYLAGVMAEMGLEPAFDGTWEQPFELIGVEARVPERWTFSGGADSVSLTFREDFIAASGVQRARAVVADAELVFAGFGIQAPEYGWDDYKGVDLRGKILLLLNNDPDWDDDLFEGRRRLYYGRWDYKYESAARQGAAGAVIVHTTPSAGYPWQVVQSSWTGPQYELPAADEPRVEIEAWVTEEAARRLASLAGRDLDELLAAARSREFEPVALGLTTSLSLDNKIQRVETANVGGLLPGADAGLRDEAVIYTAHYDHLGVGDPDSAGDAIYNGALDNASGCAQVLGLAKAFTVLASAPRRSLLFLFVAAEEQGLLGSEYYARHPSFAPGRIAANINLDNAKNIWGRTGDITFIGYGKSSLDAVVEAAAAGQGRTVKGDQFPDRGYFYRSDQFNFAKIGVPAVYLHGGTEVLGHPQDWGRQQVEAWESEHYHQPSDEYDPAWNLEGMVEDTRLAFEVGLAVAETPLPPSWRAGDEFEAARQQALATLE